ncbi:MAG: biopolymer transporter ExbD [Verrucomicrobiae bacterium]|nr:biopolymer transporter ExbD [Verrucomicrobiae bacterium]
MKYDRHQRSPFSRDDEPELNISPLIDVAFLLLIYFLVTTTLIKQEADLSMTLPGVSQVQSQPVTVDQMMIEIDATGVILVNREPVDTDPANHHAPVLTDRLVRYAAAARIAQSEALVVVKCDGRVPEQRFIDVLNACAKANIKNVSISP